jgi:hypothetical protein
MGAGGVGSLRVIVDRAPFHTTGGAAQISQQLSQTRDKASLPGPSDDCRYKVPPELLLSEAFAGSKPQHAVHARTAVDYFECECECECECVRNTLHVLVVPARSYVSQMVSAECRVLNAAKC